MANRNFKKLEATMNQTQMAQRFENMLYNVDNMIKSDSAYSTWIRFEIGKNNPIVFNSASQNKDENLIMSLQYEKSGAGTANEFTIKVAFDLFDHGQQTKTRVEKLDELLYKAMNIASVEAKGNKATDILYCKFQYGYNVIGNEQIVSPLYEGMILEIKPSINYTNGKTYYTFTGSSFITKSHIPHDYDAIGNVDNPESGWKGLDLVKWVLWYYHGNPNNAKDIGYEGQLNPTNDENGKQKPRNQDWSVINGEADIYNIDIPQELIDNSSQIQMEKMSDLSAFEYCKKVLEKTRNKADTSEDSNTLAHYELYITDSGGGGVPTIHVAYVGSDKNKAKENCTRTINFNFEWFNKTNNVVLNWEPEVNVMTYLLTKSTTENELKKAKSAAEAINKARQRNEENTIMENGTLYEKLLVIMGVAVKSLVNLSTNAALNLLSSQIRELERKNLEYYNSNITLVGIPADVPIGMILQIKPKILESISRTQGIYYVTGSTDTINTNGLFTTQIKLFRQGNLDK